MINSAKGEMKKAKPVMSMQHGASIMYHNIASKSAQSNSAYVSALHNLVEHPDGVSKLLIKQESICFRSVKLFSESKIDRLLSTGTVSCT